MNRRKVIRNISLGLSGGYLLPSILSSCAKEDPGPEILYTGNVAIIGAGAAGLYAADILHSKGIKVTVYEARDQIGGRVRSLRNQKVADYPCAPYMNSDFPVELGAQTILGSDSIFAKIFKAYSLPTIEFNPTNNYLVMENVAKTAAQWGSDPAYAGAASFLAGLTSHASSTQTVQQEIVAAGVEPKAFDMLNSQIGNIFGTNNSTLGMGNIAEEVALRTVDSKIIGLASNPMQDALVSRFSEVQTLVKLNTPIKSIRYGADPIKLTAEDDTEYEANLVIVTVPISILKSGGISFNPGLPGSFSGSLSKFDMGAAFRVILEFKKNFWGETGPYILGSANIPEYFSVGIGHSQFNSTLSVTAYGEKGAHLAGLADEVMLDEVLADLDALHAGQGTEFISKMLENKPPLVAGQRIYVRDDWTNRDYINGGFAYPLPGATHEDRINIGTAVNDKLFFAGEATDITGQAGMVNGALASAERAVNEVIAVIKAS